MRMSESSVHLLWLLTLTRLISKKLDSQFTRARRKRQRRHDSRSDSENSQLLHIYPSVGKILSCVRFLVSNNCLNARHILDVIIL
jgi:hypothetical protein